MGAPTPRGGRCRSGRRHLARRSSKRLGPDHAAVRARRTLHRRHEGSPPVRWSGGAQSASRSSSSRSRRYRPLRAKIFLPIRSAMSSLWAVISDRAQAAGLFGGNIAAETIYSVSLGATCLRLRRAPLARGADPRQHRGLRVLGPDPGSRWSWRRRGQHDGGWSSRGSASTTPPAFSGSRPRNACARAHSPPPAWGYLLARWLTRKGYAPVPQLEAVDACVAPPGTSRESRRWRRPPS